MPKFNDAEAKVYTPQPEGDYILKVTGFTLAISKGSATAGSDVYEVELEIEGKSGRVYENLIDHPKTAWKIDCFVKSMGVALPVGTDYEFTEELAAERGSTYINPFGLRGWARLTIEEYNGKKRNRVAIFYTDKPKLPAKRPPVPVGPSVASADDDDDVPF